MCQFTVALSPAVGTSHFSYRWNVIKYRRCQRHHPDDQAEANRFDE